MHIRIDPSGAVPIYQQIIQEVKLLLAGGIISPGEQLPSVRKLAMTLRVNPNTVSKAYNEMEREGIAETRRGEGTFISLSNRQLKENQGEELMKEQIASLVEMAEKFGLSAETVHRFIDEAFAGIRKGE